MRKAILALVLVMLLACGVLLQFRQLLPDAMIPTPERFGLDMAEILEESPSGLEVTFTEEGHFFTGDATVGLAASDKNATIHYTLDGNDPTPESPQYTGPITLKAGPDVECIALRAVAYSGDRQSPVRTHSYFVGAGVEGRFSTLVFSLCTDEANLYDHETGIFVEGKIREDFMAERPGLEPEWHFPANINMSGIEWERPVSVEVLTQDGTAVVSQNAGLRLHGGGTRHYPQKSLRIVARGRYEEGKNRFEYPFFEGATDAYYGAPVAEYKSLVLRSGANDREESMLRNELATQLALDAGFEDAAHYTGVSVFLNGEYYGFAWLQERVDEYTLAAKYQAPQRQMEIQDNAEAHVDFGEWYYQLDRQDVTYDFADEAFFQQFCQQVDIENLLFYYAYEIYLANLDWPQNNIRIWRYDSQKPAAHPALDHRWRHILYDTEYGFGYHDLDWDTPSLDTVTTDPDNGKYSPLLTALLERPDMAARFAAMLCDIAGRHAAPEKVEATMAALWQQAQPELYTALEQGVDAGWNTPENLAASRDKISDFFARRGAYMQGVLKERFGYEETYRVTLKGPGRVNTRSDGAGEYYVECAVPLTPVLDKYEVFEHWVVNGEEYTDEVLWVDAAMAVDGLIEAECVTRTEVPVLRLEDAYDDGDISGCTLRNTGEETLELSGLYLTDDPNNLRRWAFPDLELKPGRGLELVGSSHASGAVLMKVSVSFNMGSGESIILSDGDGNIIDWLNVPLPGGEQ